MTSWQIKELGDIAEISKGKNLSKDDILGSGKYECIHYGELFTKYNEVIKSVISRTDLSDNTSKSEAGDVLMPASDVTPRGLATASFLPFDDVVIGGDILIVRPNKDKLDGRFFAYYVAGNKRTVLRLTTGSTIFHLYGSDVKKLSLDLPETPEQKRIVSVLEFWDEYLDALDEKILLKEQLKKALMQQLLTGKKRLPGFNDEWQNVTLGDVGKVSMCKRVFSNQTSDSGKIPFYKIGTFGKKADAYIPEKLYEEYKKKYSFPNNGDILISASGTIGRTVVYDGIPAYFQDSNIIWIANNEKIILNSFLFYLYKYVKWDTASGTIARLYNDNVRRVKIIRPSLEEQNSIANILQSYDRDIDLLKQKREAVLNQKTYLLKNLITGTIRTPENLQPKGTN